MRSKRLDHPKQERAPTLYSTTQHNTTQHNPRLAKQYLAQVEAAMEAEAGSSEEDSEEEENEVNPAAPADALAARLERERLRAAGQLRRALAGGLVGLELGPEATRLMKGHRLSPTCVALSADERWAFSGGKDDAVFQYDVEAGKRVAALSPLWSGTQGHQAHEKEVLALAASSDGRYLAAGGRDREIRVWDLRASNKLVKTFTGHRDAVSALAFRDGSHALYSGSWDRCLKHWTLDGMAYVETLFGHQAEVNALDAWRRERPVSCGRDRTVRIWKLVDESHMLLRCPLPEPGQGQGAAPVLGGSLDCVAMCYEDAYVTGGEDGALALWSINRKKPTAVVPAAHGGPGHWIASVAALKGSDVVASGSDDGFIRLWRAHTTAQGHGSTLTPVAALPCPGYVNGLAFGASGEVLVAACGKEHRLGRWAPIKGARNGVLVVRLPEQERGIGDEDDDDDDEEEEEEEEEESEESEEEEE
jgi:ribosomal RNA-processing protein 9